MTTTTLITGANKGLGRETARQLVAAGHDVWLGARDVEAGSEAAADVGGRFVQLDVTSDESVDAAASTIAAEAGRLDVLINNAGITRAVVPIGELDVDDLRSVLETNVIGVVRVTNAFLSLLERSDAPVIVNVSSGLGSLTFTGESPAQMAYPEAAYPTSKAALNMLTRRYANAYPRFRVNAANPGYTATDLNGNQGGQTVAEGAEPIVALAQVGPDGPSSTLLGRNGPNPW